MINILKTLLPYIKAQRARVLGSLLFSFALAAIKGAQAYLVKPIFDKGLSDQASFGQALGLAGILLGLGLLNFPCRYFHFYWIRFVVDRAVCQIREELFDKMLKLPLSYYSKAKQGPLVSGLLNDTQVFAQGLRNSIDIIREPLTAVIMLGLALYRDWQLTLVIFAVAPLFILIFGKSGKKVRKHQGEVQEELGELTHVIGEGIAGQKVTKAFNLRPFVLKRFRKFQDRYFTAQMKTTQVEELAHPLVELVGAIAFSGVILFAHERISSGAISTGDFISFVTALALLMDPIRKYSQANVKLNQAQAAGKRIKDLLDEPEEQDLGDFKLDSFKTSIELKDLSFSYGEHDVLKNLTLSIKKGQKVAFVGPSGSGKSTLIALLLGLYPTEKKKIFIDGKALEDITLHSLRDQFGLVSQDIFLFNDSIQTNLELDLQVDSKEFEKALEISYADEFIKDLPGGVLTTVGDRGVRLSGGQQQRLTIARAYLQNCPVYLFDEATSALDNESEKVVQQALDKLGGDKTVIAVAHRLSTIQNFDQIFVLHEGRLAESGTHKELLASNGPYKRLFDLSQ